MSDAPDLLEGEVRELFADEHFNVPLGAIERAASRRRRGRIATATAGAALASAAVTAGLYVWAQATAPGVASAQQPTTQAAEEFDAGCREDWANTAPAWADFRQEYNMPAALPPLALSLDDGTPGARVYATDTVYLICHRSISGQIYIASGESNLPVDDPNDPGSWGYSGLWTNVAADGSLIVGPAPVGAIRVELELASGEVVQAKLGGGFFGYFDPSGELREPKVTVVTEAGSFVISSVP